MSAAAGYSRQKHASNAISSRLRGIAAQWLFDLQERVSLLASYERGESAPTFKKKDVTKIALGLKL